MSPLSLDDALDALRITPVTDQDLGTVCAFLQGLKDKAEPIDLETMAGAQFLGGALQAGFSYLDDGGRLLVVPTAKLAAFLATHRPVTLSLKLDANELQDEVGKLHGQVNVALAELLRLTHELDVALNGEVGAAEGRTLEELIAQVRERQSVQVLKLDDGTRINFRAPDGRRVTLHVRGVLDGAQELGISHAVVETIYDAMAAYPSAGPALPVEGAQP